MRLARGQPSAEIAAIPVPVETAACDASAAPSCLRTRRQSRGPFSGGHGSLGPAAPVD